MHINVCCHCKEHPFTHDLQQLSGDSFKCKLMASIEMNKGSE